MLKYFFFLVVLIGMFSCSNKMLLYNKDKLNDLITEMVYYDQKSQKDLISAVMQNKDDQILDSLESIKQRIFDNNYSICMNIFYNHGYPNYDLVSESASNDYWLLIQHCDKDINFQKTF